MSEAERKAEMIRKERLGETDEEDFMRDDDSDPIARAGSDKEEILASDAEEVEKIVEEREQVVRTSDSQREEILPSEDEAEPNKVLIRPPTTRSVSSRASREKTPQDRPTTSADSNREEILPSDEEEAAVPPTEQEEEAVEEEKVDANPDEPLSATAENDEDELRKKNEAATKIQAFYRGYRTRKELAVRFLESEPEIIPSIPEEKIGDEQLEPSTEAEAKEEIVVEPVPVAERQATPGPGREKSE
ncbi:unnamed protein product [Cylicostephanus goldi]|uniref:Uncharacterized protein n=1 Tax=Cylicostephanus goldi TaxID=71465 RepID=A0A3P6SGS8_CYLGO|nr:unnamed protein product [Cylicostephanus goldi]